jgi:ribosomal protein S18 acetylase RimI-like enzyme
MITEATPVEYSIAAQIHAVAQAAYTLEAERIGCTNFPPLRESLNELRQSPDNFLVFQQSGRIVGALSFNRGTDSVDITRLVVSPTHLRQGIATALLAELERRLAPHERLTISTAQANTPAVFLYQRLGYTTASVSNSTEGIPLFHLTKTNDRNT